MAAFDLQRFNVHDLVEYRGRRCLVLGVTPMSVTPERVFLVDTQFGMTLTAFPYELRPLSDLRKSRLRKRTPQAA